MANQENWRMNYSTASYEQNEQEHMRSCRHFNEHIKCINTLNIKCLHKHVHIVTSPSYLMQTKAFIHLRHSLHAVQDQRGKLNRSVHFFLRSRSPEKTILFLETQLHFSGTLQK